MPDINEKAHEQSFYRVEFLAPASDLLKDKVRVQCFGVPIKPYAIFEKEVIMPIADLPDWVTRRVAVLCTMSYEPPTEYVEKIGRRIDKYVYWIFYDGDEADGDDT